MYRRGFVREVNSLHYIMVIKHQCWGPTGALTNNFDLGFEHIKADVQNVKFGYFTIHNKPTRCNSGSIVFIKNYKYALHVSDALCVHLQEHYKL